MLVNGVANRGGSEIASSAFSEFAKEEARPSSWLTACEPESFAEVYWIKNSKEMNPLRVLEGGEYMSGCDSQRVIVTCLLVLMDDINTYVIQSSFYTYDLRVSLGAHRLCGKPFH